jgi:hypothetical protein
MFLESLVRILAWERDRPTLGATDTSCQFLNERLTRLVLVWDEHHPLHRLNQFP